MTLLRPYVMRLAMVFSLGFVLAACGGEASGGGTVINERDRILGAPEAPVTIIEYASLTCGGCAAFHTQIYPKLKEKYVDTGQVRFIVREFPTPPQDRAVAGFLLARCVAEDKYYALLDRLFKTQEIWAFGNDPLGELKKIGSNAGLTEDQFNSCLSDQSAVDDIVEVQEFAAKEHGISATPSFLINGEHKADIFSGSYDQSWEKFQKEIDALLPQ